VYRYALEQGVFLRPLWNVIYFMPANVISEPEISLMTEVYWQGIEHAVRDLISADCYAL
jgi:adenosylmethionine-8-amino-7-oxononanoate aminotransferase